MSWTFFNSSGEALVQHAESEATQAEMIAETAVAKFVPPDLVRHSPAGCKAWMFWEMTGDHDFLDSYNVTSVTDGSSTGSTTIVWADDFANAYYAAAGMAGSKRNMGSNTESTTGMGVITVTEDGTASDAADAMIVVMGEQA